MPIKPTRESIEAELNASEVERFSAEVDDILSGFDELEATLQAMERDRGLSSDRPILERLTNLGMDPEGIDRLGEFIDALMTIAEGKGDQIPDHIRRHLVEEEEAGLSAIDQLQDVLDARRRKAPEG
ncbi:hypothetical protein [Bradyrhizobium sp. Ec3.3]|uniref:hypothetical protein n=1 Tax=Bradyrhizobium sp. Ec3.3 TaxID=189753 RepID=UPI00041974BF|nr:hypothetical protein [Bradyrhizobium sp. Ec3.3]